MVRRKAILAGAILASLSCAPALADEFKPTEEEIRTGANERARFLGCLYTAPKAEADIEAFIQEIHAREEPKVFESEVAETKPEGGHQRGRLEKLARRLSITTGLYYRPEHFRVGFGFRYSRSIEFDVDSQRYALTEVFVCTPDFRFGSEIPVGANHLAWNIGFVRPTTYVARRLFPPSESWSKVLFAKPYNARRLPLDAERAVAMQPGERILMSVGAAVLWSLGVGWDLGFIHAGASMGQTLSANMYVEVERTWKRESQGRDWRVAIGGTIERAIDFIRLGAVTEEIWIKKFRVGRFALQRFTGERIYLNAGPFDLGRGGDPARQFEAVVQGIARIHDLKLFKTHFHLRLGARVDFDRLGHYMDLAEFRRLRQALEEGGEAIPWGASLTGYKGASFPFRMWFAVYERDLDRETYDESTVSTTDQGDRNEFYDYITHRQRDRGLVLFPRESYNVKLTTVQDAITGKLFTEATYELRDAHVYDGEGRRYWKRVERFLSGTVIRQCAIDPPGIWDPEAQAIRKNGLPDFDALLEGRRNVSGYFRVVLGPSFHQVDEELVAQLADADARKREKARRRIGRLWHYRVMRDIFGKTEYLENALNERMWMSGNADAEDISVSFRFVFGPHQREMKEILPQVIYEGAVHSPEESVEVYRTLRSLYDQTGSVF